MSSTKKNHRVTPVTALNFTGLLVQSLSFPLHLNSLVNKSHPVTPQLQ
jgi:hypothetical protein